MARFPGVIRASGRDHSESDDQAIAARARKALAVAFGDRDAALSIRVEQGMLTLRGEVDTIDDIDGYEYVVRQVPGVEDVDNLLRLRLTGRAQSRMLPA